MPVKTIEWIDGKIRIVDQTRLPDYLVFLDISDVDVLAEAIRNLQIRGAPAIGIAGAMGVALAAHNSKAEERDDLFQEVNQAITLLGSTRPTAVNLFWALDRMGKKLYSLKEAPLSQIKKVLLDEALDILENDRQMCRQLARNGAELLPQEGAVLTHCNAGGLATADYGTALGVIYAAQEMGKKIKVYVDETRPLLQGSRLTAWELIQAGIDVTILCDSMAGFLMKQKKIDCVLVGADRVVQNGDMANKIGTYTLAVLAEKHLIPFYVAVPVTSFDLSLSSGDEIYIEHRSGSEIIQGFGISTGPQGADVYNPAFDITPNDLVTAFITDVGILNPPFQDSFQKIQIREE
jgi:methylthioribose-1-phosphate isomerase